ncbi:MAG: tetratricopeptide repeat protein [Candidatus Eisenbacteria bacterium]
MAAGLLRTIGLAYKNLALYERAESTLVRSNAFFRTVEAREDLFDGLLELTRTRRYQGKIDAAEQSILEARDLLRDDEERARSRRWSLCLQEMGELASERGDYATAETHFLEALAIERAREPRGEGALTVLNSLGILLRRDGRFEDSVARMTEGLDLAIENYGADHLYVGQMLNNLGWTLVQTGRLTEAEERLRSAIEIYSGAYSDDHPLLVSARSNLAEVLQKTGRFDEAIAIQALAVERFRTKLGSDHPYVAHALNNLASAYEAAGDDAAAEKGYAEAADVYAIAVGEDHPWYAIACSNRARTLRRLGRLEDAEGPARRALQVRRSIHENPHPDLAGSCELLGRILLDRRNPAEAEPYLAEAVDDYDLVGSRLDQARSRLLLGECHLSLGQRGRAESSLRRAAAYFDSIGAESSEWHRRSREALAALDRATLAPSSRP